MKYIILFILIIFSFTSFSQVFITGKVLNADTGLPLEGASVFAENTTMGTSTDVDGNFKLWLTQGGYDIIVTYLGYTSVSKRVNTTDPEYRELSFQLKVKEKEMADVAIVATNEVKEGWLAYGGFFTDEFIGRTENSSGCSIKNKEVLHFFYSKKRNRLKVLADAPILLENTALGYNIRYNLDSFVHDYNTKITVYTGSPFFEEIPSTDTQKLQAWKDARMAAYNGSILQFMRSIYNRQLKENGYELQFIVKVNDVDKAITLKDYYGALKYNRDDSSQVVEIKPNQQNLGVLYKNEKPSPAFIKIHENEPADFQFSILTFTPGENLLIEKNGYYYEQNDITINAYWTWEKMADLLPYDFQPSEANQQ